MVYSDLPRFLPWSSHSFPMVLACENPPWPQGLGDQREGQLPGGCRRGRGIPDLEKGEEGVGWWCPTMVKPWQLGWWHFQSMESHKVMFQTTNQSWYFSQGLMTLKPSRQVQFILLVWRNTIVASASPQGEALEAKLVNISWFTMAFWMIELYIDQFIYI